MTNKLAMTARQDAAVRFKMLSVFVKTYKSKHQLWKAPEGKRSSAGICSDEKRKCVNDIVYQHARRRERDQEEDSP